MICDFEHLSAYANLRKHHGAKGIYLFLLCMVAVTLCALPLVYTDVTLYAAGSIRPGKDRSESRAAVAGMIDSVFVADGQAVHRGQRLLSIRNPYAATHMRQLQFERKQHEQAVHDLSQLTSPSPRNAVAKTLLSPLYRAQYSQYLQQQAEQQLLLDKAEKELLIHKQLYDEKVLSYKEYFDSENNRNRIYAALQVRQQGQQSTWQQALAHELEELSRITAETDKTSNESAMYQVIAPESGTVQGFIGKYPGVQLQGNELVCHISPEDQLMAECFISSRDVGLLKTGQPVRIQVDAFDYRYFGSLTGTVLHIDNDASFINNQPLFRIHCSLGNTQLHLRNGFPGILKKGMVCRLGFIISRRSLWQLLYDTLDDWFRLDTITHSTKHA